MEMKKVITGAAALSGLVALGQTANADEIIVKKIFNIYLLFIYLH